MLPHKNRRRNPIRTFLKKSKKTFAQQISNVLDIKNDLTAREISTILYDFAEVDSPKKYPDVLVRQHITNITKDFNKVLTKKLADYNIERYLVDKTNVFKYKKMI